MSDSERWEEAARRYRERAEADAQDEKRKRDDEERAIRQAGAELGQFLRTPEGVAAISLLKASRQRIVFATEKEAWGQRVWCLDHRGLGKRFLVDGLPKWNEISPNKISSYVSGLV